MNKYKHTTLIAFSLSLSLMACSVPAIKPTAPVAQVIPASTQTTADDYEYAFFHTQKYLDTLKGKTKLTLTHGQVTPVNLTEVTNLQDDELFSLIIKISQQGEFEVTRHPTKTNQINIKPLKQNSRALLTLLAGTEKAVLELETILPSPSDYLATVSEQKKLVLVNGKVNTIDLTAATNLSQKEYFSLSWKFSKEGEFKLALHPTKANAIQLTPLKPNAKASLTLLSGNQKTTLELTTITPQTVELGQNLALVLPQNRTINQGSFREIRVDGLLQGQLVWLGWKNSNPQAFRVENPKDQPDILRITALQANAEMNLTVLAGETKQTVAFTSIENEAKIPILWIQSPVQGASFSQSEDVTLAAQLINPVAGQCTVVFKDDTGNLLPTSPVAIETTATQFTHLWKATARPQTLQNANVQAVYTCSNPQKEITSGFTPLRFVTPTEPVSATPVTALSLKATPVPGQEYTQILLEFKPLPGIRDYKVYADERLLGGLTTQPMDMVATYKAEGLSAGTAYIFKVDGIQNGLPSTSGTVKGTTWTSTASSSGGGPSLPVLEPAGPAIGINSLSVSNACAGTSIQINGFGFNATPANNTVRFGSTAATVTAASANQLTVNVPAGNIGLRAVTVTAGGNTTTAQNFTINGTLHYVDAGAGGLNDGTSWANARTSLSAALTASSGACGDSIWVKAGTYKPGAARTDKFQLKTNVTVYGGFAGSETDLNQRNWVNNQTILSADINGDDTYGTTPPGNIADNNYHVAAAVSNSHIDGFTLIGGNADGVAPDNIGGGIHVPNADIALRNLVIESNTALSGGGMGSASGFQGTLENSVLYRNVATTSVGGALSFGAATATLNNVLIAENQAPNSRQMSTNATTKWNNVTLVNNVSNAGVDGKTLIVNSGTLIINNSIIWGNTTGLGCNGIRNAGTTLNIVNSVVDNFPGNACSVSSSTNIQTTNPSFFNAASAKGPDSKFFTTDDGYILTAGSASALDNGDNALIPSGILFDITGSTNRIVNVTVDRGAYEKP